MRRTLCILILSTTAVLAVTLAVAHWKPFLIWSGHGVLEVYPDIVGMAWTADSFWYVVELAPEKRMYFEPPVFYRWRADLPWWFILGAWATVTCPAWWLASRKRKERAAFPVEPSQ